MINEEKTEETLGSAVKSESIKNNNPQKVFAIIDIDGNLRSSNNGTNYEVYREICGLLGISELRKCGKRTKHSFIVAGEIKEKLNKEQTEDLLYILSRKIGAVLDVSIKNNIDQYPNTGKIEIATKEIGIQAIEEGKMR